MKKILPLFVPIVIPCLVISLTLSAAGQGLVAKSSLPHVKTVKLSPPSSIGSQPVTMRQYTAIGSTNLLIECSTNLIDWVVLTNIDLSTAQVNPTTGKMELYVQVLLDKSFVMSMTGFFKNVLEYNDLSTNLPATLFYPHSPIPYTSEALTSAGSPYNLFAGKINTAYQNLPSTNTTSNMVAPPSANTLIIALLVLLAGAIFIYLLYLWLQSLGWT